MVKIKVNKLNIIPTVFPECCLKGSIILILFDHLSEEKNNPVWKGREWSIIFSPTLYWTLLEQSGECQ